VSIPLTRVTTILGALSKDALIPWAVGQTLDACREKIKPGIAYSADELHQTFEWAKDAQHRTKTLAAEYGTVAHEIVERVLHTGEEPDLSGYPLEVVNCVQLWLEWWRGQDLRVVDVERYVAHIDLGYGGTVDFLAARPDGTSVLIDWKTSKSIYPEYHLQVVAYAGALSAMGLGMPQEAYILRIGKEDAAFQVSPVWTSLDEARSLWRVWAALCNVYAGIKSIDATCRRNWKAWSEIDKARRAADAILQASQNAFEFF